MLRTVLIFTIIVLFYSGCSAHPGKSNIYIDAFQGNDSNSGTSPGEAIKTFAALDNFKLTPGDTVFLKSGSIWIEELKINRNGSVGKPIVVTSYGIGEKPKIDAQKIRPNCIYLYERKNIVISNISFANSIGSGNIRIAYGENITIENCDFLVTGHGGIFIENSTDCKLLNNNITTPEGITYGQTDGIYSQRNNNILIEGNRIHLKNNHPDEHIDGIQSFLDKNIIISSNYIFQDNEKSNSQGIYTTNAQGKHIYINNVVYCPNTLASVIGFRNLDRGTGSVEVYNNTAKSRGSNNLYLTEVTDVKVKNNIFISTSAAYIIHVTSAVRNHIDNFNNNLYFRKGEGNIANYPPGGGGKTFNEWQSEGFDLTGLFADPELDESLRLMSSSPALNAGERIEFNSGLTMKGQLSGISDNIGASIN
jgi:parallel beta-helix repeat protein